MATTGPRPAVRRRTVATGAAWALPVVAASVPAPALAASGGCLEVTWVEARYRGDDGSWAYCLAFAGCGTSLITVDRIQTLTTYHTPATNGVVPAQSVDTFWTDLRVPTTATAAAPLLYCTDPIVFDHPPSQGSTSLLPAYYNDFRFITDGTIACVAANVLRDDPVRATDPLYPDSCKRLLDNDTGLEITYTMSGQTFTLTVPMTGEVGCRVVAGCQR